MNIYLHFNFWIGIVGILCRFAFLSWKEYPRQLTYTRGEDCFLIIAGAALTGWAGVLLWWPK